MPNKPFDVEFDVVKGAKQMKNESVGFLLCPPCWLCLPIFVNQICNAEKRMNKQRCKIDDIQVRITTMEGVDHALALDQVQSVSTEPSGCGSIDNLYICTSIREEDVTKRIRLVAVRNPEQVQDVIMERRAAFMQGRRLLSDVPGDGSAANVSYGYPLATLDPAVANEEEKLMSGY